MDLQRESMSDLRYTWGGKSTHEGIKTHERKQSSIDECLKRKDERLETARIARNLVVVAIAIGFAIISPAKASSPDLSKIEIVQKVERTPEGAMEHARKEIKSYGWDSDQFQCLKELWRRESNWRPEARNRQPVWAKVGGEWGYVHAGGIPQILGMDPKTDVEEQIRRGLVYIESRYGSPCRALAFHDQNNWY